VDAWVKEELNGEECLKVGGLRATPEDTSCDQYMEYE
jgi:hypothetical protein